MTKQTGLINYALESIPILTSRMQTTGKKGGAMGQAQWLKALATKSEDPSSTPHSHMVEDQLQKVDLTSTEECPCSTPTTKI